MTSWDPTSRRLRIGLRLSERRARSLLASIQRSAPSGQRNLPAVLTELQTIYLDRLADKVAARVLRSSLVTDPATARQVGMAVSAATTTALSKYLLQRGAQLGAAVADPAAGVTITATFTGLSGDAGRPVPAPSVAAQPGWHHV